MGYLIFGLVFVVSLGLLACAAPQQYALNPSVGQRQQVPTYQQQVSTGNALNSENKQSAYKNNTRESPEGEGELFGYPENQSIIESKQNARNRTPVFIPNRCEENEILYPGDQESDWVCDCKPTFVYHPTSRQCYQLFTKGYCQGNNMLILRKDAKQPECVPNRCHEEGKNKVEFEGTCVELNAYNDKCLHHKLKQLVSVREDTNELGCVNISDVVGKYDLPSNDSMANNRTQQRRTKQ